MDLRQLRYFVVLATQQHFGRAASVLHVAQPALSRQIQLLEEELGVQLFERHPRGATPTPEALFLLERASFLLRYAEQMKQDMTALQRDARGPVVIGMSPGLAQLLAVPLTKAVHQKLPDVRLRVEEGFSPALHSMLLQGALDIAVLNGPVQLSNLVSFPLLNEEICLIGRSDDPILKNMRISIQQLVGVPLIMTGLAKSGVRLELEAGSANADVTLNQVVEVSTMEVAKRLIQEQVGLTVHFAAAVKKELDLGLLAAVPIEGLQLRRILARVADRPPSKATEELIDIFRNVVEAEVQSGNWPNAVLL